MTYTVTAFNRSYEVLSPFPTTLDMVWASEKCFFSHGCKVVISDEFGLSKEFVK